jgi:para-aminobenzoate synthetase/4-amino-4-deoxychorismate lyase
MPGLQVCFSDGRPEAPEAWSALPVERVLTAAAPGEVPPLLAALEQAVEHEGFTAVGFVAFEAAPAFDPALVTAAPVGPLPLAWFALGRAPVPHPAPTAPTDAPRVDWQPALSAADHAEAVARIRAWIAAGDTYQVNFTFPLLARLPYGADPAAALLAAQPTPQSVRIDTPAWTVACASPELFFAREGDHLVMRPMKGTRPRGRTTAEDQSLAGELHTSVKDRAENVMIVDMVRNDLGRFCRPGSVQVDKLFAIERYPTVWQMTSTVSGQSAASLPDVFRALFPCASVTGAPKARTLGIIHALECGPRGVYTGAVGVLRPGRQQRFAVAIRTLVVDRPSGVARYDVGSGVVWDSDPAAEYRECLHKAAVLHGPPTRPELLTTLRWTPGEGAWLRDRHLARLAESATYFGYVDPRPAATTALDAFHSPTPRRLRLLASPSGEVRLEHAPLPAPPDGPWKVRLDDRPLDTANPYLFHKTTHRAVYEAARARHPDYDDVLLWNERGELTEATTANLALRLDGIWYTPPVACGLLAGLWRAERLARGELHERVLQVADLRQAEALLLLNSVRGNIPACWVEGDFNDPRPH